MRFLGRGGNPGGGGRDGVCGMAAVRPAWCEETKKSGFRQEPLSNRMRDRGQFCTIMNPTMAPVSSTPWVGTSATNG